MNSEESIRQLSPVWSDLHGSGTSDTLTDEALFSVTTGEDL